MQVLSAGAIVNDVALGLGLITTDLTDVFGSTDQNIIQLVRLLKLVGRSINQARDWSQMTVEAAIVGDDSAPSYDLPVDFLRIKDGTAWNRTTQIPLAWVTNAQQWQALQAISASGMATPAFRIYGNALWIYPRLANGDDVRFEYQSTAWTGASLQGGYEPGSHADKCWFESDMLIAGLRLEFLKRKGMATPEDQRAFDDAYSAAAGGDRAMGNVSLGGPGSIRLIDETNVPETGYGS